MVCDSKFHAYAIIRHTSDYWSKKNKKHNTGYLLLSERCCIDQKQKRTCLLIWASVVDIKKLRKTIFRYKMINFSLRQLKFSGNMYFSSLERLASAKVEKVLSLHRNHKKVTLLLIYLAFKESILKNYQINR